MERTRRSWGGWSALAVVLLSSGSLRAAEIAVPCSDGKEFTISSSQREGSECRLEFDPNDPDRVVGGSCKDAEKGELVRVDCGVAETGACTVVVDPASCREQKTHATEDVVCPGGKSFTMDTGGPETDGTCTLLKDGKGNVTGGFCSDWATGAYAEVRCSVKGGGACITVVDPATCGACKSIDCAVGSVANP